MARRVLLVWLFLFVTLLLPGIARAQVGAYADGDHYWIARRVLPQSHEAEAHTSILQRSPGANTPWREVHRLVSRVTDLAHRGGDLVTVLDNGSWRVVSPNHAASPPSLPDAAALRQIASVSDGFYAIGEVVRRQRGQPTTTATQSSDAGDVEVGDHALYRFTLTRWERLGKLDEPLVPKRNEMVTLTTHAAAPVIGIAGPDGLLRAARHDEQRGWVGLPSLDLGPTRAIKWLDGNGRLSLWVQPEQGNDRVYFLGDDRWDRPVTLSLAPELANASWRTGVAVNGSVRVVGESDGKLFEQAFARDGTPETLNEVTVERLGQRGQAEYWLNFIVMLVLLVVMFTTLRQRPMPTPEELQQTRLAIAPIGLRLLAGIIDAIPVIVGFAWMGVRTDGGRVPPEAVPPADLWLFLALVGLYLAHTTLSELFTGRTLGKLLCGLRVRDISGGKPRTSGILLRNLVRILDLALMLFPLLFILFSPLRQRVGDMAGGTVVTLDREPPATPDEDAETR